MTQWIALSDQTGPPPGHGGALIDRGLFVMDVTPAPDAGEVMLDYQADDGWARTFSIFIQRDLGVIILHRQGRAVMRHALPGPLPAPDGPVRLSFGFDAPARQWSVRYESLTTGRHLHASGVNPLPLRLDDLSAICAGRRTIRHPAVRWFGVTVGDAPPVRADWIGVNTPIDTPDGPCAAGRLRPGDRVMSEDGPQALHAVTPHHLPCRGPFAPVLLRAPFHGVRRDLLVSADQLIALGGPEVEYLFAEDEVLVPARVVVDQHTAVADRRRHEVSGVSLTLAAPTLLSAAGCGLLSAGNPLLPLPRRVLDPYEIVPLMALRARQERRSVGRR